MHHMILCDDIQAWTSIPLLFIHVSRYRKILRDTAVNILLTNNNLLAGIGWPKMVEVGDY